MASGPDQNTREVEMSWNQRVPRDQRRMDGSISEDPMIGPRGAQARGQRSKLSQVY